MTRQQFVVQVGVVLLFGAAIISALPAAARQLGYWLASTSEYARADERADAIIVLGGNTIRRMQDALSLYEAGIAPQMALTGLNPDESVEGYDEVLLARDMALQAGVPEANFTLLPTTSTAEDAEQIAAYTRQYSLSRVLIVSDWTHARRAMCTIKASVGSNATLKFSPSDVPFTPDNWWTVERGFVAVVNEVIKMAFYTVRYSVGMTGCYSTDFNGVVLPFSISLALISAFGMVYAIRMRPKWFGSVDIPNERSSHTMPTPRGGGLGIFVTCLVLWLVLTALGAFATASGIVVITSILGGLIALVGWLDDRASLSAGVRLMVYAVVCGVATGVIGSFDSLMLPFIGTLSLALPVAFALTFVWVLGFLNIFNFMDGIDGLAGNQAAIAAGFWSLILWLDGQPEPALFAITLCSASLGFLWHNNPPAKIFMGDVGSAFLGFNLALIPILAYVLSGHPRYPVIGVMLVAPFVLDGASTIIKRALRRENVFKPHRSHLYQRLVIAGLSHRTVTRHYRLLMIVSSLCAVLYMHGDNILMLFACLLTVMSFVLYALYMSHTVRSNFA